MIKNSNKNIINKFRENREIIFGYSSFIGLITTSIYTVYSILRIPSDQKSFLAPFTILALSNLFFGIMSIYAIRRYDKLNEDYHLVASTQLKLKSSLDAEINIKKKLAQILHNFCHQYRKLITEMIGENTLDHGSVRMFFIFMLTNIKEIFDIISGDECSVCIKLIEEDPNEKFVVRTYLRDPVSYRKRSEADRLLPIYPFHENTAFLNILDDHHPASYYFNNDLSKESDIHNYRNANASWKKFYNACLVAPIRFIDETADGKEPSSVLGFICVDNFKGGFDDEVSLDLLAVFADLSFHLFHTFFLLHSQEDSDIK